jgi:hypothetical protein
MSNSDLINADEARKFLQMLHDRAAAALSHVRRPGVLQLVSIAPDDKGMSISPFVVGDVDRMVEAALIDARAGRNVFVEARSTRPGRPVERGRGKLESTIACFALVIDRDADKGRGGHANGIDTTVVETSPGNCHEWLFLRRALDAGDAKPLGEKLRKAVGADHATGVVTQPYRIPGLPNFPDARKRERGRVVVPTKLIRVSDKLWTPVEIEAAFSNGETQVVNTQPARKLAGELKRDDHGHGTPRHRATAKAKIAAKVKSQTDRSAAFHAAVCACADAGMSADEIETEMRQHPEGPQQKYLEGADRLHAEIGRSLNKVEQQQQQQRDEERARRAEAGNRIDGAELLDRVYEFLGRFIVYPDHHAHVAHALWIAHCHLMDCFETTPRLAFLSPEPSSGKTRALEITELLVPSPVLATNVSPAYLIRRIGAEDGVTILFDEIDTVFGPRAKDANEDVRALLNAGYRRGAVVGRCVMHGATAVTEELPSFAPAALAGLGRLPDTVLSRSIVIRMQRRAPDEHVIPYRRRDHAEEGQRLCGDLAAWAAAAASRITIPDMPGEVVDRDADCWEPLLAVADAAAGHWPDTARCCAVLLVLLLREEGEERLSLRLLADMRTVLGDDEQAATTVILDKLHALDESPWADIRGKPLNDRGLATRLRPYHIKPRNIRIGEATPRGYRRADFVPVWKRYLPSPSSG